MYFLIEGHNKEMGLSLPTERLESEKCRAVVYRKRKVTSRKIEIKPMEEVDKALKEN